METEMATLINAPPGTVMLGQYQTMEFRWHNGELQYADSRCPGDWLRNTWESQEFVDWVNSATIAAGSPRPPAEAVDDEEVELAIKYSTLENAISTIKELLAEPKPVLEEIRQCAIDALEDTA
jgi:hypothetical protein